MRLFEPMLLEECACQMVHGEESASVAEPHLATVASLTEVICNRLQRFPAGFSWHTARSNQVACLTVKQVWFHLMQIGFMVLLSVIALSLFCIHSKSR